jgi:hypothetical protein
MLKDQKDRKLKGTKQVEGCKSRLRRENTIFWYDKVINRPGHEESGP